PRPGQRSVTAGRDAGGSCETVSDVRRMDRLEGSLRYLRRPEGASPAALPGAKPPHEGTLGGGGGAASSGGTPRPCPAPDAGPRKRDRAMGGIAQEVMSTERGPGST